MLFPMRPGVKIMIKNNSYNITVKNIHTVYIFRGSLSTHGERRYEVI